MSDAAPRSSPPRRTSRGPTPRRGSCGTWWSAWCRSCAAAIWFFGPSALLVIAGRDARLRCSPSGSSASAAALGDGSRRSPASCSGLTLPPGFPLWMAFLGGVFAIALRQARLRRARAEPLQPGAARPRLPAGRLPGRAHDLARARAATGGALRGDNFALPLMSADAVDASPSATPLGLMKFEDAGTELGDLLLGTTGGSPRRDRRRCSSSCAAATSRCATTSTGASRSRIFATVAVLSRSLHADRRRTLRRARSSCSSRAA